MPNLYELMGDYVALQEALDSKELTNERLGELLDAIDEAKGPLREKVDNIARLIGSLEGDIVKFKREEARLSERRKAIENRRDRLRGWVRGTMTLLDKTEVKTDVYVVKLLEAKDRVEVLDAKLVPDAYVKVERKIDKKAVMRAYLEDGEIVPGCDIVKGKAPLRIR